MLDGNVCTRSNISIQHFKWLAICLFVQTAFFKGPLQTKKQRSYRFNNRTCQQCFVKIVQKCSTMMPSRRRCNTCVRLLGIHFREYIITFLSRRCVLFIGICYMDARLRLCYIGIQLARCQSPAQPLFVSSRNALLPTQITAARETSRLS